MLPIGDLSELPARTVQAVIINCGTKWVTSLALMSVLRNTECPVVIIDCESEDDSYGHFTRLAARFNVAFHWLEWPLRSHPVTLDRIFHAIRSEAVLLVDSDVEIKTRAIYQAMLSVLDREPVSYGAGFLHRPEWLGTKHGLPAFTGYYAERMWIPLVLLRVPAIRAALDAGCSFMNERRSMELASKPRLARLMHYRYYIPGLRRIRLSRPGDGSRPSVDGHRPAFVEYDTGARLHSELKRRGYTFAEVPRELFGSLEHLHGVTRARLAGLVRRLAWRLELVSRDSPAQGEQVIARAQRRLANAYGISGL